MSKARDLASAAPAPSTVSATELGYVDGVTSAIQTQLDAKAASSTAVTLTGTQTLTNKTLTNPVIASVVNNTLTSTTGDMIYASAANTPARLGIGSTDQVLKVTAGVPAWSTPAAGGSMTLLSTTTLSGTSTTISSINQTYTDLFIIIAGANSSGATQTKFELNADSAQNWSGVESYDGDPAPATFNSSSYLHNLQQTSGQAGNHWGISVYNYSQSVAARSSIRIAGMYVNSSRNYTTNAQGARNTTTAITSVKISTYSGTWSGGTIYIYGVK